MRLTVTESGRLKLFFDRQLKVPIFTFSVGKGGQISKFIFRTPQKALPGPERRIMTYCAWGMSRDATCGRGEEMKKDKNCLFAHTTHVDVAP